MHRSRLGTIIIDCQTDDFERDTAFWSAALGGEVSHTSEDGRYADVRRDPAEPHVILQKVEHPSRVHLDIETDDREAEVRRLEDLGATIVEHWPRWTIMQAPSGHRFCIIGVRRDGFEDGANLWE